MKQVFSSTDHEIFWYGALLLNWKSLELESKRNDKPAKGARGKIIGYVKGDEDYSAKITIGMDEFVELQKAANGQSINVLPPSDIIVTALNEDMGIDTVKVNCKPIGFSKKVDPTTGEETVYEIELLVLNIESVNNV